MGCETLLATCTASGTNFQSFVFTQNGVALSSNDSVSINVTEISSGNFTFTVATLLICSVTQAVIGEYQCVVSNGFSMDAANFNVSLTTESGNKSPEYSTHLFRPWRKNYRTHEFETKHV